MSIQPVPSAALRHRRRDRGLTLVEALVTLSIVALLTTLAAPSLGEFVARNRTASVSNELVGTLMRARTEAVGRNACTVVCRSQLTGGTPSCSAGGNDWAVGWIAFVSPTCDPSMNAPAADDILAAAGPFTGQFSVTSTSTSADRIMFGPTGTARTADAGRFDVRWQQSNRASNRGVCLSPMGRTRLVAMGAAC